MSLDSSTILKLYKENPIKIAAMKAGVSVNTFYAMLRRCNPEEVRVYKVRTRKNTRAESVDARRALEVYEKVHSIRKASEILRVSPDTLYKIMQTVGYEKTRPKSVGPFVCTSPVYPSVDSRLICRKDACLRCGRTCVLEWRGEYCNACRHKNEREKKTR